jgi:hypothetical protein
MPKSVPYNGLAPLDQNGTAGPSPTIIRSASGFGDASGRSWSGGRTLVIYPCLPSYQPLEGEVPVAVQTTSWESASRKVSRKPDEEMELKKLVRNVRVDVDIATVLDRIVNSIGWSGSLGSGPIRVYRPKFDSPCTNTTGIGGRGDSRRLFRIHPRFCSQ